MQSLLLITSGEKMFVVGGEWDCQNWVYEGLNESDSRSVVSDSLRLRGLYSSGNLLGQNTEGGSLSLL